MKAAIALAALCIAGAVQAAGVVQTAFVNPDEFTDVRDRMYSSEHNLKALDKAVQRAASPYVADGQTLKVEVLDVDLAGEVRPGARPYDIRVLRGTADWPRITLRWTLEGAGAAPRSGEAVVQDMAYLQRLQPPLSESGLVYEQRMLQEYFRSQLGARATN
jgi:hypothetical protein